MQMGGVTELTNEMTPQQHFFLLSIIAVNKHSYAVAYARLIRILTQNTLNFFHRHSDIMSTEIGSLPIKDRK